MGQAKHRGNYEERKQQAIIRQEREQKQLEEYRREHPPKRNAAVLPLYATMVMLNMFPYYPLDRR